MNNVKVGFVGTGAMGAGMVTNLCRKGARVSFYVRDTARGRETRERLAKEGGRAVTTLAELGRSASVIILCLPDSPSVEGVLAEEAGLVPALGPESIIVDCSTSHPDSTRRLASELGRKGIILLDGPLTGSRAQAESGTVSVLGAGPKDAFERVRPVLAGFAAKIFHLGGPGAGHAAKLMNNFFGQLALAGLCEAWPLIEEYGIEPGAFFDAVSASGGNSALFQGAFPRLLHRDFTLSFAQKLAAKDVRYFRDIVESAHAPAPMAEQLLAVHERATADGFGDQDVKALLLAYEKRAESGKSESPKL